MARPSKYKPEYCKEIIKFFDKKPYVTKVTKIKSKKGNVYKSYKYISCDLPLLSSFAIKIGVNRDTLNAWDKKYKEFSAALKKAKDCQRRILITNGIKGLYNTAFAIFTAKNIIGWRDRQDITSGDEKLEGIVVYKPKKKEI